MTKMTFTVSCVLFLLTAFGGLAWDCYAETTYTQISMHVKIGDVDGDLVVSDNERVIATIYGNGEDCGNTAHRTAKGHRYFSHAHTDYDFGIKGIFDKDGKEYTLTDTIVRAHWDMVFVPPKISEGGENVHVNCHGYALGLNIWVQGVGRTWILDDDYNPTTDEGLAEVLSDIDHSKKITHHCDNGDPLNTIQKTREKFLEGGIYRSEYYCPGGMTPDKPMYIKKQ